MDFDFVDECRPNFRLQSNAGVPPQQGDPIVDRRHAAICVILGMSVLLCCAWVAAWSSIAQLVAAWIAVSLILGPLAPISLTAGDCSVGQGVIVAPLDPSPAPLAVDAAADKKISRSRKHAGAARAVDSSPQVDGTGGILEAQEGNASWNGTGESDGAVVEGEWSEEEVAFLRKQLAKHPRGTARRWQVIAQSFGGSRTVDNVIQMAKALADKKPGDEDAYAKFLAQRKVSSRQISLDLSLREEFEEGWQLVDEEDDPSPAPGNAGSVAWSDGEDKALLAGLKAFPKGTPSRWDRIQATVRGRSKSQCLKRYLELRDGFRSSKLRKES
ncbi:transcription factor MAMYB [Selaginella moellendorffii]|uniref:transcription factor MAMYB n=1 Tax=Selaginella moellendorffii TaxID=88036 RepID=UPI000D1C700D|nr:transcription factor MAMYB [Selaginella moellendorffii]|eukprot:XP_024529333.1 transcription factor MAMYB [Selaginella moellendorffii]